MRLKDMSDEPFIRRGPGSGTRMAVDANFRRERFAPRVRLELGSNEAIREAVAGTLGLAVVSAHALGGRGEPGGEPAPGLRVLDLQTFPIPSAWHVVHPRGRRLSPVAQAFRDELVQAPAAPASAC